MDDEKARELYMEYRSLTEQLQKVQAYLQETVENVNQVNMVIESLDQLGKLEKGARIFAPIANGIFVDATLHDPRHVRLNVGGKVVVNKSVPDAKRLLEGQRRDLEGLRDRAQGDAANITKRLRGIETTIESETADEPSASAAVSEKGEPSDEKKKRHRSKKHE